MYGIKIDFARFFRSFGYERLFFACKYAENVKNKGTAEQPKPTEISCFIQ